MKSDLNSHQDLKTNDHLNHHFNVKLHSNDIQNREIRSILIKKIPHSIG